MSGFQFKQFAIQQDRCAMKVGTDGVLLGAWATTGERMLDIGTGTGLIALMLAQRSSHAIVDAVEIDEAAAEQARENVVASPFADRVNVVNVEIQNFIPTNGARYDVIVSNPPYFQNALGSPDKKRHAARHTDSLSYRELLDAAVRLLREDGRFCIIIPFDSRQSVVDEALLHGFSISRECAVRTTQRKTPRRYLLEFSRRIKATENRMGENSTTNGYEEVVLTDGDGGRSKWYQNITKEFYLF